MRILPYALIPVAAAFSGSSGAEKMASDRDLFKLDLEQLLTVNVESPSKFKQIAAEAPAIVSVISKAEIDSFGANSLLEILDRATSVNMTGSFFFEQNVASIRGDYGSHSDNHVLLLLNGRPMRESFTGGEHFAIYNAFAIDLIKQIEIIRGPGSVLYGSGAYDGVINIITQAGHEASDKVGVTVGSFSTRSLKASTGYREGELSLVAGFNHMHEDGWRFKAFDNNAAPGFFDAGEDNHSVVLAGHYGKLTFNSMLAHSRQDFWGSTSNWSGEPPQSARDITSHRFMLDLGYRLDFDQGQYLDSNISYTTGHFSHYNYDSESQNLFAELTYQQTLSEDLRWLIGTTAWHQNVSSSPGLRDAPVPPFDQNWWTFYAQLSYRMNDTLNWVVGAQTNKVPEVSANTVPRIGLIYKLDPHTGLKVNYGQAFRAAYGVETNFDLVLCCKADGSNRGGLRGNPELKPETITTSDLQYYHWGKHYQFNATLFLSRQKDLIARHRAADNVLDFVNKGTLDSQGLELEFKYGIDIHTQLTAAYTYQTNETVNDAGLSVKNYTLQPNHMVKLGITRTFDNGMVLGIFDSYFSHGYDNISRSPNRLAVNPPADSYHLVSAKLSIPLQRFEPTASENATLDIYGYNLLDESIYQPELAGGAINTNPLRAGRSLYLTVNWVF